MDGSTRSMVQRGRLCCHCLLIETDHGLVLVDDFTHNAVRSPGSYSLIDAPNVTAGCIALAPLPNCDDNTLLTDAIKNSDAPTIYLWADATHLAPTAHLQIGNQANSRAHSNPF